MTKTPDTNVEVKLATPRKITAGAVFLIFLIRFTSSIIYFAGAISSAIISRSFNGEGWGWFFILWDFFLWPLAWIKWLVCQQVNLSILKTIFSWYLQ
jgi:hypothetical protein